MILNSNHQYNQCPLKLYINKFTCTVDNKTCTKGYSKDGLQNQARVSRNSAPWAAD